MTTTYRHRWLCMDCPEHGTGTAAEVQRAAERHGKTAGHSTRAGTERAS